MTDIPEAVAWMYTSDDGSQELVLDCNGGYARRYIEMGYTETPLYTRPEAIPAEAVRALVEALEIARKTFAEYAELHSSKLDGALSLPEQAAIVSKVGRNRALEANCMHALATIKGYKL